MGLMLVLIGAANVADAAYHHEGERDAGKFLEVYPDKAGTKLDHCALCHGGGEEENNRGQMVSLGSCQWCHSTYGYDASGGQTALTGTLNAYGLAYLANNRTVQAIRDINDLDSDGDGHTNATEIAANRYPGDAADYPGLTEAPFRVYTRAQLEALPQQTQFLLMNTSRSGDFYAEYTGVPMKDLLDDAGILDTATGITVFAPDGWSQYHPLYYDAELDMYHVYGNAPDAAYQYPPSTYYYDSDADQALNPSYGWCDYSAPSCAGRSHGTAIQVSGGLKAILALTRDGAYLDPGVLTDENKLDGSGPFRVVVPQKYPEAPDQSSRSNTQDVIWPYNYDWDHNAGSCTRSTTIIRVEPLPDNTTDIDILEMGWNYIDQAKIIVYGAIDGTDSNGNGILDSEEGRDEAMDMDDDGVPDYRDPGTASFRHAKGETRLRINASHGEFSQVAALSDDDPSLSQLNKPADRTLPYGVMAFTITGLTPGQSVTVHVEMPENVPENAEYYKITSTGWNLLPLGSNDGDRIITLTLTDGDPATDTDGLANGTIVDPGGLTLKSAADDGGSDSSCFIGTLLP
jgi:hypothetical protein